MKKISIPQASCLPLAWMRSLWAKRAHEHRRKEYFDPMKEIVRHREPFSYPMSLVNKGALAAVSPQLHDVAPIVPRPDYWNIARLPLDSDTRGTR